MPRAVYLALSRFEVLEKQGRFEEAFSLLCALLEEPLLSERHGRELVALIHARIAGMLRQLDRMADAEAAVSQSLSIYPTGRGYLERGMIRRALGADQQAWADLHLALTFDHSLAAPHRVLGEIADEHHNPWQARRHYQKFLSAGGESAEVEARLRELGPASQEWRRLLEDTDDAEE
ncbi:MAG: hypothetical protein AB1486_21605 [Planctomycetota bacterium]